ncbi:MAG: ABC transporter permease [Lachnospiraceae bacterium]|nr:ABC transporter permease [Lachnospiraceae bacterium]
MQTFKLFMTLLKRNLPSVSIYVVIFAIISVVITSSNQSSSAQLYQDEAIPFTVIDEDKSALSEGLREYLAQKNEYVEHSGAVEELQMDMYYRDIYYVLIIPEGFEEGVKAGEEPTLQNYKIKDSSVGYYMDLAVESYMSTLRASLATGVELSEAIATTGEAMQASAEVSMQQKENTSTNSIMQGYFQTLPYILLAMLMNALGNIMISLNREKVRLRANCSSLSMTKRNLQIALGTALFGLMIWVLFEVIALVLYAKQESAITFALTGMNTLCFVLMTVALSVMIGFLAKKEAVLSAVAIIVSLGASFLGGVFVPLEVMGEGIIKVAKFLPTYWYVTANSAIVNVAEFSEAGSAFAGMGIQLLFAAAFFTIAMVASRKQK